MNKKIRLFKILPLTISVLFLLYSLSPVVLAANTTVSLATQPSSNDISITSSSGVTGFSSLTVADTWGSNSGSVASVAVTDNRGAGTGWGVIASSTHLNLAGGSVKKKKISGSGASTTTDVTVSGYFDGSNVPSTWSNNQDSLPPGEYVITVNTIKGSSGTPDDVTIVQPDGDSSTSTLTISGDNYTGTLKGTGSNAVGMLSFAFASSTRSFAAADKFGFLVDTFSFNQLAIDSTAYTPDLDSTSSPPATTAGIAVATSSNLVGNYITATTSSTRTDVTAEVGEGMGTFFWSDDLRWASHPRPIAGTYNATLTYTITGT